MRSLAQVLSPQGKVRRPTEPAKSGACPRAKDSAGENRVYRLPNAAAAAVKSLGETVAEPWVGSPQEA